MTFEYKETINISHLSKELEVISEKVKGLNLLEGFFTFILYAISELFINVKEHAKISKVSIILKISKQKCLINISDRGVGLRQPYLSKQIYVKDDWAAIEFALSGLSTKNLQERGFGLYSIRRLTEELKGKMTVESGSGQAIIQKNKINFQNLKNKIQGTIIKIETPIKKIDFYKIIR